MRINRPLKPLIPLLLVVSSCFYAATVQAEEVRHFDWLTAGKVSGSHVLVIRDDGTLKVQQMLVLPLVAGTDAMAGFTLHRELELYQKAGISSANVLKIATLESARVVGVADRTGSISVGKQADFVLLAGNPLEDISAVRKPVAVFKGDRWYDPAQLYEAIGVRPFTR